MTQCNVALRSGAQTKEEKPESNRYRYEHLLPYFAADNYPPLTPFEHIDPGSRALSHPNPRAFLDNATKVTDLTPTLGTEVQGLNLTELDSSGKDQLALEVIKVQTQIAFGTFYCLAHNTAF
jgi:sulfonate dioxygenase